VVRDPRNFPEDCQRAAIIITPLVAPAACAETALVVDRSRLRTTGTVELTLGRRTASDGTGGIRTAIGPERRPWQQGNDGASLALRTPLAWPDAEAPDAKPVDARAPAKIDPTEEPEETGAGAMDQPDEE
jgi:competence protein ComEC